MDILHDRRANEGLHAKADRTKAAAYGSSKTSARSEFIWRTISECSMQQVNTEMTNHLVDGFGNMPMAHNPIDLR